MKEQRVKEVLQMSVETRAGKPRSGCNTEYLKQLHAQGLCDTEIARIMGKAPKTIRTYRNKLGLPLNKYDPRSNNGVKDWDQRKALYLYDLGCSDAVIARELGIGQTTVYTWRQKCDLPANYSGRFNKTDARRLYDAGYTDRALAEALGVSRTAILRWREENSLERNIDHNHLDTDAARKLHSEGYNDVEIADELGVCRTAVLRWRTSESLPNNKEKVNDTVAYELWEQGFNDREIADTFGVSVACVWYWRKRNNLTPGIYKNANAKGKSYTLPPPTLKEPEDTEK